MVLRHASPGDVPAFPHDRTAGDLRCFPCCRHPPGEAQGKDGDHRVMLSGTLRCHP